MAASLRALRRRIRSTQSTKFEDDTASSLESAYDSFLDQFETSEGGSIKVGHEPEAEAMDASERGQERVQVKRGS